ncbi:MAG: hypothetical protein ACYTG5_18640 [Planctomycetota bacterium]|jgi:hypothetical protein
MFRSVRIGLLLALLSVGLPAQTGLPADAVGIGVAVISQGPLPGGPAFVSVCEGFTCRPLDAEVFPGSQLRFQAFGGSGLPWVMLASFGADQCQVIPGINGALALNQPLFLFNSGVINPPIAHPCNLSDAWFDVYLPTQVPAGLTVALQVIAFDATIPDQLRFSFSRPMLLSTK